MSIIVDFTALLFQRECYIVSYCPELHVGSFGDSVDDALSSLREAVECFLEGCKELGTLDEVLEEAGYAVTQALRPKWKRPPLIHSGDMEVVVA
jgi:predicted RNase H-like HicB family nuclease